MSEQRLSDSVHVVFRQQRHHRGRWSCWNVGALNCLENLWTQAGGWLVSSSYKTDWPVQARRLPFFHCPSKLKKPLGEITNFDCQFQGARGDGNWSLFNLKELGALRRSTGFLWRFVYSVDHGLLRIGSGLFMGLYGGLF